MHTNQGSLGGIGRDLPVGSAWAQGAGPLYRRLADAIDESIRRGDLSAGTMLPPERHLAEQLAVSRSTAAHAYRTLRARGRLESRQGRGTWVAAAASTPDGPRAEHLAPLLADHAGDADHVDLALAAATPRRFDAESASNGPSLWVDVAMVGTGYEPAGLPALRQAIASYYGRCGLATTPDQVLVTSGAQHALSLTFAELVAPGDAVVVEESTFVGALDLARAVGARVLSVPSDAAGVDVAALAQIVERHRPALVYLNPTHQTPTGTLLADDRRRAVVAMALRTGVPVIDDGVLAALSFVGHPAVPLAAHHRRAPILTVGSLSKVVWAGLRVGWVRADRSTIEALTARRMVDDLGGSLPAQLASVELVDQFEALAAVRAADLHERHDHLLARLAEALPDWTVAPASGGTVLWAELPRHADAEAFATLAAGHGVSVVPGPAVSVPGTARDRIRLAFTAPVEELEEGVRRLATAWDDHRHAPAPRRAPGPLV
jgi:DNA-binding transcriptional MocR family regulator